ncbi:OadG family protein [Herbivorax sp. ANBcel31]|uniref:OadG family protein n=1 Tax=Herbivorax sp. ANBcel31 TaxID=3069754 RepID=UPI0027B6483E|nr:OadG family protein [Herbivorax sp. ANBcel31]MDQ2085018.1 OadG family protein [Herbivorax sp. ANBcel31]
MIDMENLNFALGTSLLGITIVFSALVILCMLIKLFPLLNYERKKSSATEETSDESSYLEIEEDDLSDDSLIAVLTAAVMASMRNSPDIKIKVTSFKRIPQTSPVWNTTGRNEHISGKL